MFAVIIRFEESHFATNVFPPSANNVAFVFSPSINFPRIFVMWADHIALISSMGAYHVAEQFQMPETVDTLGFFPHWGFFQCLDIALSSLRASHFCFHIIFWHTITNFCPRLCFFSLFNPVIAPGITAQLRLIIFLSECAANE